MKDTIISTVNRSHSVTFMDEQRKYYQAGNIRAIIKKRHGDGEMYFVYEWSEPDCRTLLGRVAAWAKRNAIDAFADRDAMLRAIQENQ